MRKAKKRYISLQKATKFCDYSQEYLSLRARQKKLKARKRGRNWFTTKAWLKTYVRSADEFKGGKESEAPQPSSAGPQPPPAKEQLSPDFFSPKYTAPPDNLPVVESLEPAISDFQPRRPIFQMPLRLLPLAIIFFLCFIAAGAVFGKDKLQGVSEDAVFLVREFNRGFDRGIEDLVSLEGFPAGLSASFLGSVGDAFRGYGIWLGENLVSLRRDIAHGIDPAAGRPETAAREGGAASGIISARTARVERFEMVDQSTGETYCVWLANGDLVKLKAECEERAR